MLTDSASSGGNKPTQGQPAPAVAGGGKPNPGAATRSVTTVKPAASPAAPGRQPTAQISAAAPGRQATAQIPAAAPGRQPTAQIPTAAPGRQATARIPAVAPARQPTAQIPAAAPGRQATARIPVAARPATTTRPVAGPPAAAARPLTTTRPVAAPTAASPAAGARPVTTTRPVAPPPAGGTRPVTTTIPAVPAAAHPGTARIPTGKIPKVDAAAGPRSTGAIARVSTGRIPVAAPSTGGTSTRVPRVTTGRVPVSPDAARTTASLRRATRTTAVRRQGSTFALPSSRKVRAIALLAILGLGGAVAGLGYKFANTEKPEAIIKKLEDEFKRCREMPDTDITSKCKAFQRLMDSELDPKATVQIREEIKRYFNLHVKERAAMELDALRAVPVYLKKFDEGRADPARQEALYDEVKALKEKFGYTSFGPKIDEIAAELLKVLESRGREGTWVNHFPELLSMVVTDVDHGDARAAIQRVKDFGGKWKEGEDADLAGKLKELREKIQRESVKFANKRIREARKLFDEGKKDEAAKLLRDARAGLEGCAPDAIAELDKAAKEMK